MTNMKNELRLVKTASFGNIPCNFYQQGDNFFMTREQIGNALEYRNPATAIAKIHARYKDRFDNFSTYTKLVGVEGNRTVEREAVLYSTKGVYEICRWSRQSKANQFYDFVYEMLERLRKGELKLVSVEQSQFQIPQTMSETLCLAANLFEENEKLRPKAEAFDEFLSADNASTIGTAGQFFGKGQQRFFNFLREQKILKKKGTTPYQRYLDSGYFNIKYTTKYFNGKTHVFPVTLITPKGLLFLARKFDLHPVTYENDYGQLYLV